MMMKAIKHISILLLMMVFASFSFKEEEPSTYSLTVEVNNTRNSEGVIQFTLYNKDGSIPDEKFEKYYKILTGNISEGTSSVTFINLPQGTYVVNILHDENVNGKIDKGFILPVEGLGFSNYTSLGLTNRPKYSKASFELSSNKKIEVKVIYM